ncbi:hypothetical protein AB0L05_06650 [Nonomuraea pusilla]|uniref:hypothetical protein n=1 Tax=Nonomuraea pusilla TaxID=46177 RepID=UPI003321A661
MNPQDAQASLDQIRAFQDRTREEMVRKILPWPFAIVSALGLLAVFASIDLEWPWKSVALGLGLAVYMGSGLLCSFRATVHPKPRGLMIAILVGMTPVYFVVFVIGRIAGFALFGAPANGLLSQAMVGAALVAVVYIAITPLVRRIITSIALQADGPSVR